MTPTKTQKAHFSKAYGAIHLAAELSKKLAGDDGQPDRLDLPDVHHLQNILREAGCAANAITGTHDGHHT